MKVLVMSDSHKDLSSARLAIRHMMKKSLDIVIHCGDHIDDAKKLEKQFPSLKFYYVPGNCDGWFFKENEKTKVIQIKDKKVLITHGDQHYININYNQLFKDMKLKKADIGLCGHSHIARVERQNCSGLMVVNPGSISLPRDSRYPSYAVLDIEEGKPIEIKNIRIKGRKPVEIGVFK